MSVADLQRLCQPLYGFVYTYFDKPDFEAICQDTLPLSLTVAEIFRLVQQADQMIQQLESRTYGEDDILELWSHRELLLKTLVILTHLPPLIEQLGAENLIDSSVEIRNRLIDVFSNKAVEDPNVVKAIQNGTLEQEIEQRRTRLFNFKPLFEKHRSFVVTPDGIKFQEIPERF